MPSMRFKTKWHLLYLTFKNSNARFNDRVEKSICTMFRKCTHLRESDWHSPDLHLVGSVPLTRFSDAPVGIQQATKPLISVLLEPYRPGVYQASSHLRISAAELLRSENPQPVRKYGVCRTPRQCRRLRYCHQCQPPAAYHADEA